MPVNQGQERFFMLQQKLILYQGSTAFVMLFVMLFVMVFLLLNTVFVTTTNAEETPEFCTIMLLFLVFYIIIIYCFFCQIMLIFTRNY